MLSVRPLFNLLSGGARTLQAKTAPNVGTARTVMIGSGSSCKTTTTVAGCFMPTVFNSSSTEGLVASLGFFAAAGIISYYRGRKAPIITRNLKRFIGLVRTAQLTSVEGYVERVEKRRLLDSLSLTGDLDMAMPLGIGDYNYFACLEAANPNGRAIVFRERYRNWSGSRHSNIDASGRDRISLATLARTCRHLGIVGEALPEISMALVTDDGPMSLEKIARMLAEARERGLIES